MNSSVMGFALFLVVAASLALPGPAAADPTRLDGGVLILHNPVAQSYSIEPSEGWCQNYRDRFAITGCDAQVNRIDAWPWEGCGKTFFVLAAWTEPKEFSVVEFGMGGPSEPDWWFGDWGACLPGEGFEEATPYWPGPGQGVRISATAQPWIGSYVPVYFFCGGGYYVDAPHRLPLTVHPETGFAGFRNALAPPQSWGAVCLGAMGWLCDGIACCPQQAQGLPPMEEPAPPDSRGTWGSIKSIYL